MTGQRGGEAVDTDASAERVRQYQQKQALKIPELQNILL